MLARVNFMIACAQFKAGKMSAGQLAVFAARDAGIPDQGTESLRNRRECAARTAALARWSRLEKLELCGTCFGGKTMFAGHYLGMIRCTYCNGTGREKERKTEKTSGH